MGLSQVLIQKDACIARFLLKATNMVCVSYRHAIHVFSRTQFCWQVGKSSLVSQCITSDYINTYDASLGALTNLPSWDFLSRLPFPHCRRRVRREVGVGFPGRPRGWDHLHRPPKQRNVGELVRWCHKKRAYLLICLWPLTHVVNQTTKPTIWDWSDLVRFKAIPSLQRGHCALVRWKLNPIFCLTTSDTSVWMSARHCDVSNGSLSIAWVVNILLLLVNRAPELTLYSGTCCSFGRLDSTDC